MESLNTAHEDDFGRYDDIAFPYPYLDMETDYPIHFPNFPQREDTEEDDKSIGGDFWDSDPFFWSITSDEEWKKMEELAVQIDAKAEDEDHEFFKFEKAPLRHIKKKGWKNG